MSATRSTHFVNLLLICAGLIFSPIPQTSEGVVERAEKTGPPRNVRVNT
jgi:hypothetical protein